MERRLSRVPHGARFTILARDRSRHECCRSRSSPAANIRRQSPDASFSARQQRSRDRVPDREPRRQPARRERKYPSPESVGRHRSFRRVLQRPERGKELTPTGSIIWFSRTAALIAASGKDSKAQALAPSCFSLLGGMDLGWEQAGGGSALF